mmetsp:Transcript_10901/g.13608  ORF Transcript_10901/g.13608 Transcript_10901/m.13608 type:complete len:94 (+) Transcript_10901:116-397(+)
MKQQQYHLNIIIHHQKKYFQRNTHGTRPRSPNFRDIKRPKSPSNRPKKKKLSNADNNTLHERKKTGKIMKMYKTVKFGKDYKNNFDYIIQYGQ